MRVYFSQIYIQEGVNYPFSHVFQQYLSKNITELTESSEQFDKEYGNDWDIMFRISAKKELDKVEIKGPTVFKKTKDVEYTIFLPFVNIDLKSNKYSLAIENIIDSVCSILVDLNFSTTKIRNTKAQLINEICQTNEMFKQEIA